ncbi:NADH dehydrogenase [ubiquinone] 1 beta subcomplex subunit 8, mitochondrial [Aethina tumida]|uniref:NADH dehydrogenase [ubiquinone] 1 beta subcomplex subunit 8, mitochondrial n=1 Tax=Aethina tumida TaxID=116153 RepID=UPI00096B2DDA|nr:NADH dehydrogenase [ubiquinone] 1 beta subcomplex subunit 8, mitochondrial [Aethina tumida]
MNSIIKSAITNKILKSNAVVLTALRNAGHWNKDYKPGPYPKTEEEMVAAAKKYNLSREEYKPYKDDGSGCGDYPDLPLISNDSKDPFYPYDNPELKRNFGETLHSEFDLIREDRYDVSARLRHPMWVYWTQFLGVMVGCFVVYGLFEQVKMFPQATPRQYPNKTHYTFEPKE